MNQINVMEVKRLFYKGSLGNQIFLKSEKAFQQIYWRRSYEVTDSEIDINYDRNARREVSRFLGERIFIIGRKTIMKQPAYDECYLDMMFQKTRCLFKLVARNDLNVFSVIRDYMKDDYRKYMDMGTPLYLNKTPKQIFGNMGYRIKIDMDISLQYDEMILEWMADIYVYMQWKFGLWSAEIVDKITPKELYKMYYPLHEASVTSGCEKLMERYIFQQ